MIEEATGFRNVAQLKVARVGRLRETGNPAEPLCLLDPDGGHIEAVSLFLRDLLAMGRPATTLRSYGFDLLRWFRFLWTVDVPWHRASQSEARDFCIWLRVGQKPERRHWRAEPDAAPMPAPAGLANPVTGKVSPGASYSVNAHAHNETVVRTFYDFHRDMGTGPILNPFPLDLSRKLARANGHHNPLEPYGRVRIGRYRPKRARRIPRSIPDEKFNELFARLPSHRDRALVAFFVSTGARASELLGARACDVDPGRQVIGVIRKGSRALQELPASPDAFVWLRLYQHELRGQIPRSRTAPLWWTLTKPSRPLTYHAAKRMFERCNALLGADWGIHDLRHTAAYRMARDPDMPLTDVQWILGHADLRSTQVYLTPHPDEVIERVHQHHARQAARATAPVPAAAAGYDDATMRVLFGTAVR